jgi:hypothetical protein
MAIEKQLIEIIATDRMDIPISSMSGKLKRRKPKLAQAVDLNGRKSFSGDRAYARVKETDREKARGMKEGIAKFADNFPKYGRILQGYIDEQRTIREKHLYFGMNDGCRLTTADYIGVLTSLGFSESVAEGLYPELIDISRNMSRKRDEERSIMVDSVI